MKVLGATCGIGSMLIGAEQAGFKVVGNIDWRPYVHHRDSDGLNTFEENFLDAFLIKNLDNDFRMDERDDFDLVKECQGIDLIMGHPDCGNYSVLSNSLGCTKELSKNPGDIPIFVDIIKRLRPRFFVQDNLPKSLIGYPIQRWAEELPEYDLFPEWVSNWNYGNIQKFRKRFFMIGALKTEKFSFSAAEYENPSQLHEVLYDPKITGDNNESHSLAGRTSLCKGILRDGEYMTWEELQNHVLNNVKEGKGLSYIKADGTMGQHIGTHKFYKDKHAFVLTGGSSFPLSPWTGLPFSIRERARIQGCPDSFKFYGTKLEGDGTWLCTKNNKMIKQIAKFMPIQFCKYVSQQIADHINGEPSPSTSIRMLNPNKYINETKIWYCNNIGYSDQHSACDKCWMYPNCGVPTRN